MSKRLISTATALAVLSTPVAAFDLDAMSKAERDAFGKAVRGYLLENPEVIMEAVRVLEDRQAAETAQNDVAMVEAHKAALFDDGYSYVGGNPDGDVTIVEFVDYRCGFCRRAHDEVAELIASDRNIRIITKEFPILGPDSQASSEFAIAVKHVAGLDAYKRASDALIRLKAEMNEAAMRRLANTLSVDADAVLNAMKSDKVKAEIAQTRALAQSLQINGTPTFVFGDQLVRGYKSLAEMRQFVADAREDS
ncbi:MAG: DsbA family protein [Marinovum sp.]|nr:DsbA family protein [Marinovum sp.]